MRPAVSVVIPCFNLGAYLDEAVASVLAQTRSDAEILIVDDGSDDPATRHMLTSYRRPRTRVIRTPNRGLASARNTGLEEARGRFVSFLDADDLFEPRFLEVTIGRLEADDSLAFASCWLTAFGAKQFDWRPERCDFPWLLAEDTVCTAAPARRDALLAIGGYDERPGLYGYEDWALAVDLVERGHRGEIVPESLFRYRIRPGSMSSDCTSPRNHMRVFETMLEKHADSYAAHADGVLAAIGERIAALEALMAGDPPPRPQLDGEPWRTAIPRLERHRRGLEQALEEGAGAPGPPADATAAGASAPAREPVAWGSLRRTEPVSRVWGLDRGQPVDRHYIERFLAAHADDVAGDVLEVKDPAYTRRFERGARSVTVLDVAPENPDATLIADLTRPQSLPESAYDCVVITQTLQFLFDVETAVANLHRALAPGGVVLATVPCVSRIDYEAGVEGDFWRFTAASARRLFEARFGAGAVEVQALGNVLASTAFLHGLASDELAEEELAREDPYFPLLIAVRAVKDGERASAPRAQALEGRLDAATCGAITGWAFDPAAPGRRLKLDVWDGERRIGAVWADRFREDLAAAGKADGAVAFRFVPERPLHGDPPPRLRVTPAGGGEPLPGSPLAVRCTCEESSDATGRARTPGLLGAALDAPAAGAPLPFPWLEVVGWAVGADGPVEAVELCHRGEPFRRIPLQEPRPDIAQAHPDCPWAERAGFTARVSLVGTGGTLDLDVLAVLADGRRVSIGQARGAAASPPPAPLTVVLDAHEDLAAVGGQDAPASRVLVRGGAGLLGHPGFGVTHTWSRALDEPDGLVWLSDGRGAVTPGFLAAASAALCAQPHAAFAAAAAPGAPAGADGLVGALSGTALGAALLLRASALRAIGGVDEGAAGAVQAQWDLGIRLAEAGYAGVAVEAMAVGEAAICERADEEAVRALYRKHAPLYEAHLREVLLDRERAVGALLRENHLAERALEEDLRPRLGARRRERDRLGAKLRRPRAAAGAAADAWGDLRRLEPLSPLWGEERGLCVDRRFIEDFLEAHADDVHGRVLAYHDARYATRYGRQRLTACDVLDADATNPAATVIADLQDAPALERGAYDCVLLPHVLQLLEEPADALAECARVLRPGGVLLATVPAAGRVEAGGPRTDCWRFSAVGFGALLEQAFGAGEVEVTGRGGEDATLAFLAGLAAEEVEQAAGASLEGGTDEAPLVIVARAVKAR